MNGAFFGLFMICFLMTLWFFAFGAKNFQEYAESLFFVLSALLLVVWYAIFAWQKTEYCCLFDELDTIIDT